MKMWILILGMMAVSSSAYGEFSGAAIVQNDRIFRGASYANGGVPAVSGVISWKHESGFFVKALTSNLLVIETEESIPELFNFRYEVKHGIGYKHMMGDWALIAYLERYYFPDKQEMNANELSFTVMWNGLKFLLAYMPEFFQWEGTDQTYIALDYSWKITDEFFVVPHVGYNLYGDDSVDATLEKRLHQNYQDWSLAVQFKRDNWTIEMGWSDTNRKLVLDGAKKQKGDSRPYTTITRQF